MQKLNAPKKRWYSYPQGVKCNANCTTMQMAKYTNIWGKISPFLCKWLQLQTVQFTKISVNTCSHTTEWPMHLVVIESPRKEKRYEMSASTTFKTFFYLSAILYQSNTYDNTYCLAFWFDMSLWLLCAGPFWLANYFHVNFHTVLVHTSHCCWITRKCNKNCRQIRYEKSVTFASQLLSQHTNSHTLDVCFAWVSRSDWTRYCTTADSYRAKGLQWDANVSDGWVTSFQTC